MTFDEMVEISEKIEMNVSLSPMLISNIQSLVNLSNRTQDNEERSYITMTTIVMAITTIEAFLSEFARFTKPNIYTKNFKNGNIFYKFKKITGKELEKTYPEVKTLLDYRHDIIHHMPHNKRALYLGKITNDPDGAMWAVKTMEELIKGILGCKNAKLTSKWIFI